MQLVAALAGSAEAPEGWASRKDALSFGFLFCQRGVRQEDQRVRWPATQACCVPSRFFWVLSLLVQWMQLLPVTPYTATLLWSHARALCLSFQAKGRQALSALLAQRCFTIFCPQLYKSLNFSMFFIGETSTAHELLAESCLLS